MSATVEDEAATNQVYNVDFGERTSLNELFNFVIERVALLQAGRTRCDALMPRFSEPEMSDIRLPIFTEFRNSLGIGPNSPSEKDWQKQLHGIWIESKNRQNWQFCKRETSSSPLRKDGFSSV